MSHQFPSERHRRLDIFVGTWDTTVVMTSADGNAAQYGATDSYQWSANGFFLMHDVTATMGDDPITSLEIIAADPLGPHYVTRSYDADGTINDFTARLDGDQWFIEGTSQRFAGAFAPDHQSLAGHWELLTETGWASLMQVTLHRRR